MTEQNAITLKKNVTRIVKRTVTPRVKISSPRTSVSPVVKKSEAPAPSTYTYFTGVGRRKEAVVSVRLTPTSAKPEYTVNGKPLEQYFSQPGHAQIALASLHASGAVSRFAVRARAHGGGVHAQAVAMRMGIARALVVQDAEARPHLRTLGYLTRDSRAKERKKPGLKRARRAPQFSKR